MPPNCTEAEWWERWNALCAACEEIDDSELGESQVVIGVCSKHGAIDCDNCFEEALDAL